MMRNPRRAGARRGPRSASVADYEYDCCEATATSLAATHLAGFNGELMPREIGSCIRHSAAFWVKLLWHKAF